MKTEDAYCKYLNAKFSIKYSQEGVKSFDCPMHSREGEFLCLETLSNDCYLLENLGNTIKKTNGVDLRVL